MFDRILIANRGEIACRVARTARRLGIHTVAVYSDADAGALHVTACDEAYRLGPASPRESYLRGDRIIEVALASGAQAIHPGYGFLSENDAFAAATAAAGLVFVGPPPSAIRAMGSKSESKSIMAKAGVRLVPGYHGDDQHDALLARQADAIGYPVLIKASAGGGGKGMRIVERHADFAAALASARREAKAGFGDDKILLEKYLEAPRHIEMQVFADAHGHCMHLFERDCSVQRRHQKVLEEAPAPGMTRERRNEMGEAAVAAAKAIGYIGAGTVEFIVDKTGLFHFMEMNTRLQVEHPVTEMITGLDLVEWQLRVASGEPLPLAQDALDILGHAIEARIYAEDPARGFLPSIGRIAYLEAPSASEFVRIDTGVRAGDEITQFYDPMIAKLVVWGEDRAGALRRLRESLARYRVAGVTTNIAFLQRVVAHPAFAEARLDTDLIGKHQSVLLAPPPAPTARILALAAVGEFLRLVDEAGERARTSEDRYSPWSAVDPWWINSESHAVAFSYSTDGAKRKVRLQTRPDGIRVSVAGVAGGPDTVLSASATRRGEGNDDGNDVAIVIDGIRHIATVVPLGDQRYVFVDGELHKLALEDPLAHASADEHRGGHLTAPMSGTIVAVLVKAGDAVAKGAPLVIVEAMKMEHTIAAPAAGRVGAVHFSQGDQVSEGANLIDVEAAATDDAKPQAT
jgi:3-methylcrotonyl-CoA carboxylase alpha subunit